MPAWIHNKLWDSKMYQKYRTFVHQNAKNFEGDEHDCADISLTLLIEFAAEQHLPVTFWDNDQVRYISKGSRQTPGFQTVIFDLPGGRRRPQRLPPPGVTTQRELSWKDKDEYLSCIQRRVGAKALFFQNTIINSKGPEEGDLMCKPDHTALVFAVYPSRVTHPQAWNIFIPVFPGEAQAEKDIHHTQYFRTQSGIHPSEFWPGGPKRESRQIVEPFLRIDFLNHRGKRKPKAELMLDADPREFQQAGFQFRMYKPGVIDNWLDWDGHDDPPR